MIAWKYTFRKEGLNVVVCIQTSADIGAKATSYTKVGFFFRIAMITTVAYGFMENSR